jgi:Transposase DDE domain
MPVNAASVITCHESGGAFPPIPDAKARADGRFGKQDFAYLLEQDVYRCPSGNLLPYHYSNVENGMTLRRYWSTAACQACAVKSQCMPSKERRITRWEHERVVEEVQRRLDANPDAMRTRRET